jgi:hypothetical protein
MKKKIFTGIGIVVILFAVWVVYGLFFASKPSPSKTTEFSSNGLDIKVVYSQPYKKGRLIFGEEEDGALQPYGKYWRLGANEATEITFSKNINFGGKPVDAGTYRMYAVPNATSWQVSLNSELGVFFGVREPDYDLDVAKVEVPAQMAPSETEQFVINFSNDSTTVNMDFVWDRALIRIPITLQ